MDYEAKYDQETNILYSRFIGTPNSFEDAEYIAEKNLEAYKKGEGYKVWQIIDIIGMEMAHPKYVNHFSELDEPNTGKYVIDYCTVCKSLLERIATKLYGALTGNKKPIFASIQKAEEWVLEQQLIKGVRIPVSEEDKY